ncbi:MAG: class I SAM-dependent methyltransferase [Pirellulaceae bacterium]|nr:class I SAM-dependent methyltransferase [Planctomycetales bacterium]
MLRDRLDMLESILPELYDDSILNEAYSLLAPCERLDPDNQAIVNRAMTQLIEGLYHVRVNSSDQEWNSFVKICLNHPLKDLLHQDPFTFRAFSKPRGYAGDAVLLDFIYGREEHWPPPTDTTPLGRMIYEYTTTAPASAGSCARRGFVADKIDSLAMEIDRPELLSIACGHMREASLSSAVRRNKTGRFLGLDSDTSSLETVQECYGRNGIEVVPASIRHLLTNRIDLGHFDMVYSTGLFDYLQQKIGQRLAENMFEMVKPGGRMLIANVLPNIRDVGYMESYMDWTLIPRTRKDMIDLTSNIPEPLIRDVRVFSEENVNIIFLELTKK